MFTLFLKTTVEWAKREREGVLVSMATALQERDSASGAKSPGMSLAHSLSHIHLHTHTYTHSLAVRSTEWMSERDC